MPHNFAHQDLRGRDFSGQDLSGTNFDYADLRGTNFARAILKDASFIGARCGRSGWGNLLGFVVLALVNGIAVFLSEVVVVCGGLCLDEFLVRPLLVQTLIISTYLAGFAWLTRRYLLTKLLLIAIISLSIATIVIIAFLNSVKVPTIILMVVILVLIVVGAAGLLTVVVIVARLGSSICIEATTEVGVLLGAVILCLALDLAKGQPVVPLVVALIFNLYFLVLTSLEHPSLRPQRQWGVRLGTLGGTDFRGADLSGARLVDADVRHANFFEANLLHVVWTGAKQVQFAYLPNTPLAVPETRAVFVDAAPQATP